MTPNYSATAATDDVAPVAEQGGIRIMQRHENHLFDGALVDFDIPLNGQEVLNAWKQFRAHNV